VHRANTIHKPLLLLTLFQLGLVMALSHFAISLQLSVALTHQDSSTRTILMFLFPLAYTFVGFGAIVEERLLRPRLGGRADVWSLRAAGLVLCVLLGVFLRQGIPIEADGSMVAHAALLSATLATWFLLLGSGLSQLLGQLKLLGHRSLALGWALHLLGLLGGYLGNHALTIHVGATAMLCCIAVALLALPRRGAVLLVVLLIAAVPGQLDTRLENLRAPHSIEGVSVGMAAGRTADQSQQVDPAVVTDPVYRGWSLYSLFSLAPLGRGQQGYAGYYNFRHQWNVEPPEQITPMKLLRRAVYRVMEPEHDVLIIGVGGGVGVDSLSFEPHAGITLVERDEAVVRLFADLDPSLNHHRFAAATVLAADGRFVAETLREPVDVIAVESAVFQPPRALVSLIEPYWLYTEESLGSLYRAVGDDGLLLINVNVPVGQRAYLLMHTYGVLKRLGAKVSVIGLRHNARITRRYVYLVASPSAAAHDRACARMGAEVRAVMDEYGGSEVSLARGSGDRTGVWGVQLGIGPCKDVMEATGFSGARDLVLEDDRPFLAWIAVDHRRRVSMILAGGLACIAALLVAIPLGLISRRREGWNPIGYFFLLGLGHTTIQMAAFMLYHSFFGDEVVTMMRLMAYHLLWGAAGAMLVRPLAQRRLAHWKLVAVALATLGLHGCGLLLVPFDQSSALLRELFAALALLPGGMLLGLLFPLGLARCRPEEIGRCLLADALGVVVAYGVLVVVAMPLGIRALLGVALLAYALAVTLGWGRGWIRTGEGATT